MNWSVFWSTSRDPNLVILGFKCENILKNTLISVKYRFFLTFFDIFPLLFFSLISLSLFGGSLHVYLSLIIHNFSSVSFLKFTILFLPSIFFHSLNFFYALHFPWSYLSSFSVTNLLLHTTSHKTLWPCSVTSNNHINLLSIHQKRTTNDTNNVRSKHAQFSEPNISPVILPSTQSDSIWHS